MIGLIVTGHANFGSGMTSSVNLIAGEQEAYRYVDFLPTYGTEELTEEIAKAMDELKDCEGIIIFTDLMGGSPFNVAASLGHGKENIGKNTTKCSCLRLQEQTTASIRNGI